MRARCLGFWNRQAEAHPLSHPSVEVPGWLSSNLGQPHSSLASLPSQGMLHNLKKEKMGKRYSTSAPVDQADL